MTARRDYGPVQLARFLDLQQWQLDRAVDAGLIPAPDTPHDRWSAAVAAAALARIGEIRAAAGSVPDLGALRAADLLTRRLGVTVTGDSVAELARHGLLPVIPVQGLAVVLRAGPGGIHRRRRRGGRNPGPGSSAPPMSPSPTCASAAATWTT